MRKDLLSGIEKVSLIECFSGIGTQASALKEVLRLTNLKYELNSTCEWDINAIASYKEIHCGNDHNDYSKELTKKEIVEFLFNKGISSNGKSPLKKKGIQGYNEKKLRTIYNNIIATKNHVNIMTLKGEDLNIVDTDKTLYILTYSFPCQDLSVAGKSKGMSKGSGTRSSLLWEVERLLKETKKLPQVLLMENVTQVHGRKHLTDFNNWINFLNDLGYTSYYKDLNGKDYGIPQNRNRTFMVSILGDYYYEFPKKLELRLRLKDMLEDEVEEKYYLSDKKIAHFTDMTNRNGYVRGKKFRPHTLDSEYAYTINTTAGSGAIDNFIILPENTKKGCAVAHISDKVDKIRYNKFDSEENIEFPKILDDRNKGWGIRISDVCPTQRANRSGLKCIEKDFRIRKLTPKECWRLMGISDDDFEKARKVNSNTQLYKQAGNAIITTCLIGIFGELFGVDYEKIINKLVRRCMEIRGEHV